MANDVMYLSLVNLLVPETFASPPKVHLELPLQSKMISALTGRLESQLTSVISISSALAMASEDRAKRSFMVDDIKMVQGAILCCSRGMSAGNFVDIE